MRVLLAAILLLLAGSLIWILTRPAAEPVPAASDHDPAASVTAETAELPSHVVTFAEGGRTEFDLVVASMDRNEFVFEIPPR